MVTANFLTDEFDDELELGASSFRLGEMAGRKASAMRIGFDETGLYITQAGIARYVRGLKRGLERLASNDIDLIPVAWEVESFGYRQPWRALRTAYRELYWGRYIAPKILQANDAEILHSTSSLFIRPPASVKHVVSLHDLSISRHPERFRKWQVASWHRRLNVIRNADRVIAISTFTADEAIKVLELPAAKIEVIHNGCDWHENEIDFDEEKPPVDLPSEFFLFVGSLEPGKNLKLLKQAYTQAELKGRRLPPLVIVGARWQGVEDEGAQPRGWYYLGRQPDSVLLYLYRRAISLLFPSIYEGFGLPIVEAMAQGCPVICSPVASMPEVAGDAALMPELTPEAYVLAMRELLRKPATRDDLIARGRKRAPQFTWRRCAEETLSVYRDVQRGVATQPEYVTRPAVA